MGRRVQQIETQLRHRAARQRRRRDALEIPDSDYVLTLDADSVLLREYCLRLVHQLELPGNERIAVIQTPYSAFRGAEHPAGADRGRHHRHPAPRAPGADLLRRHLLGRGQRGDPQGGPRRHRRGLATSAGRRCAATSRTAPSSRTPSRASTWSPHGWTLSNYPERLSYSATPTDFGSLAVQRARWANGGLLIAPKFWRLIRRERKEGQPRPRGRDRPALQLHGLDLRGRASGSSSCWSSRSTASC